MNPAGKQRLNAALVWIFRLFVGGVFMVSGAAKMIDLYGFIYKIYDYLAAWGTPVSEGYVFFAAMLLSGSEFLIGVTLGTGSMRRMSVLLASALMLFMLPLTLYIALYNPVADCGCFGDFLVISNWATFWKNVAICVALGYLLVKNRTVEGLFTPMSQWMQVALAALWVVTVGMIGYHEQPMIDFRAYPEGEPLLREANFDGVLYRYSAPDGSVRDFAADELPDADEGWTFLERIDSDTSVDESAFAIFDEAGEDVTYEVIGVTPAQLLLLVPDIDAAGISDTYTANELAGYITGEAQQDSPDAFVAIVHASSDAGLNEWLDMSMANYPIYTTDDRTIKAVARGTMALVYLENDTIRWKRTLSSIDPEVINQPGFSLSDLNPNGVDRFRRYTLMLVVAEIIVMLLGRGITFSRLKFMRARRKRRKALEKQPKIRRITNFSAFYLFN